MSSPSWKVGGSRPPREMPVALFLLEAGPAVVAPSSRHRPPGATPGDGWAVTGPPENEAGPVAAERGELASRGRCFPGTGFPREKALAIALGQLGGLG